MKNLYTRRQARLLAILIEARQSAGINQQELCKRLKRNRNFVSTVERGIRVLDAVELIEYAAAVGLDPRDVIDELMQ